MFYESACYSNALLLYISNMYTLYSGENKQKLAWLILYCFLYIFLGDEVLSNLENLAKGAAKKRVSRPQPKLNSQRWEYFVNKLGTSNLSKLVE